MPTPNITKFDISTTTLIRILLIVFGVVFLYLIRNVVAIVLFSVVIASSVEPAARWFSRFKVPHVLGVLFVYIIAFTILGVAFSTIVPPLFSELTDFSSETLIQGASGAFSNFMPQLPAAISSMIEGFIEDLRVSIGQIAGGFYQATSVIFGGAFSFILIIIISFYLSVQKNGVDNFLRIVTPPEYKNYILDLWGRSSLKIGRWLQAQILLGLLIGALVYIGLTILQVKFALSLAILAAIFELIPLFGPILAAVPAVIIAFLQSPTLGLVVLLFYIIVGQFENHLIVPVVFQKAVGVPPILVIISLIVGGQLGGFFGLLLAVPIAAVLVEISKDILTEKADSTA